MRLLNMFKLSFGSAALAAAVLLAASHSSALNFTCISASDAECLVGEAQFSATVSDLGGGQALLTFSNTGPDPSIIADVYLDDDASVIMSIASIQNGTGVEFAVGASPGNLPGGNNASPAFSATAGLTADANAPTGTGKNGADPGESFSLVLNLTGSFADVEAAIDGGTLRFGIHGQGLGRTGGSKSFVSGPGDPGRPVPEPGAALLFGAGALTIARRVRRR
jgi:PEP-CTERM motif